MNLTKLEISDRFAEMWRKSREDAGKSQAYMAKAMGVSKKTVQNWEQGISCPAQDRAFEWFQVLGLQPLPYYLQLLFPDEFESDQHDDEEVQSALMRILQSYTPELRRKLLYFLSGEHGSSPFALIEMTTAHLQSPLRDRINVAQSIAINYELAKDAGMLKQPDDVQPNMQVLNNAIELGKQAFRDGSDSYTTVVKGV